MHKLIINADDFGLTDGVTAGIVEAIESGAVTNTTAMACVQGVEQRLRKWGPRVRGRVGAHLQLTSGKPLTPRSLTPSLADSSGWFPEPKQRTSAYAVEEIVLEWEAQLALIRDAGVDPDHLDSHHHVHKIPNAFQAFCEIARRHNLPARAAHAAMIEPLRAAGIACPDLIVLDYYQGDLSAERLLALLTQATANCERALTIEVMCHPGYSGDGLTELSDYVEDRERELETLRRSDLKLALQAHGFALTMFSDLKAPAAAR